MSVSIYNNGALHRVSGNGYSVVDPTLDKTSVNAVQNKVVAEKIEAVETEVAATTEFKGKMIETLEELSAAEPEVLTTSPASANCVAQLNWRNHSVLVKKRFDN